MNVLDMLCIAFLNSRGVDIRHSQQVSEHNLIPEHIMSVRSIILEYIQNEMNYIQRYDGGWMLLLITTRLCIFFLG